MKLLFLKSVIFLFLSMSINLFAQQTVANPIAVQEPEKVLITKNDGTEYIGVILEEDGREVLLLTESIGELYIPKHEIKSIVKITADDYREGVYMGNNMFATRYVITTNGLPMKKGDTYAMIQLFGAEFQTAVSKNVTVGVITTWIAMPLIGSAKFSFSASDKLHFALGTLIGSGTWLSLESFGALGYGSITLGDHNANISFTAGYVGFNIEGDTNSDLLLSLAGMARINEKISFVGDSFIYPGGDNSGEPFALIIPALRFRQQNKGEFQFGLGMIVANGGVIPSPVPMISWFRKF